MTIQIKNARIITPLKTIEEGEIAINDEGKIEFAGKIRGNPH